MKFSVVFENSGDELPFTALSPETLEVLEYYIHNLETNYVNEFIVCNNSRASNIADQLNKLIQNVSSVNEWIYPILDGYVESCSTPEGYFDQDYLNRLHANWVLSHSKTYDVSRKAEKYSADYEIVNAVQSLLPSEVFNVDNVISRLGLMEDYRDINHNIHDLERMFNRRRYKVNTNEWVEMENPFSKTLVTNDLCNFNIDFNHLGRPTIGKFQNFDNDCSYDDENQFNELLSFASIGCNKPQTTPYSKEFVEWCEKNGTQPVGRILGIGNLIDLEERLFDYRKIYYRNVTARNSFMVQL